MESKVTRRLQSVVITKPSNKTINGNLKRAQSLHAKALMQRENQERSRSNSLGALEDIVQCAICLDRLNDPRMLPCQHTFCLSCLQSYAIAKNISRKPHPSSNEEAKSTIKDDQLIFACPTCLREIVLTENQNTLETLPKNLYIESLLKVIENRSLLSAETVAADRRCVKCQHILTDRDNLCQHCVQFFCGVCWNEHILELESNLPSLIKQLNDSEERLEHKLELYENRCDQLNKQVEAATKQKIFEIEKLQAEAMNEIDDMKTNGRYVLKSLKSKIEEAKERLSNGISGDGKNKVTSYISLHEEISKIFDEVYNFGEEHIIFDPRSFKLEQDSEGIYNELPENDNIISTNIIKHPLESAESLVVHYKMRSYVPKLVWTKCPRPAGVAVSPWDNNTLYIAATDNHDVLIFNKKEGKLIGHLSHSNMICPVSIAFSIARKELYVSDKWNHCIHIFSQSNEYLSKLGSKGGGNGKFRNPDGLAIGPNDELYVCDTGNNRISVIDTENGEQISSIGVFNGTTTLNMPTGIAVYGNHIIVADTGNHRIKTFTTDGEKIHEFGSLGRNRGQLRSAEVVAVDPLGFIFVGDGGNARIQIFKPNGTLVKIFGSKQGENGFKWVSGICITPDLDIITTDNKSRCLKIF